jgi:hypothetical protein
VSTIAPRVTGAIDESDLVVLRGNVHPLARPESDRGAVEDGFPAARMLLLLLRSGEQEAELQEFIRAAHTPGDPRFHQWLKPREFGLLYGPADSDIATVTEWLESHGFTINKVHAGRVAIEFSGTAGQVREAFHTEIHRYAIDGEMHIATDRDPEIPAALAPVIAGLAPVNDFHARSNVKILGSARFNRTTHEAQPEWTYPEGGGNTTYVFAPGDFATQYDINSVYKAGTNGAGQSIAILSASNVDLSLVAAYQKLFGLAANLPQVVIDGIDPGQNGAATEAYLDLEVSDSVAPGATVILYTSDGTATTDGLTLAAYRAVEDDVAGVLSTSYGECEESLGQSGNTFWNAIWQQAAAQGQTAFVSAGDGGSAGCDDFDNQSLAYYGLQVNGIASTPYDVAVGGTDFYYSDYAAAPSTLKTQLATYWSASSSTAPAVSLLQYVPEQVWNDFFGLNTDDAGKPANLAEENIVAGGGGKSSLGYYASSSAAAAGYPKPAWQSGTGVPADAARDLPDVALFAANGANSSFYPICASPGDCSNVAAGGADVITGVGGTSAASPAMAGIQALVNQSAKSWQGQADFIYYPLATKVPTAFHDVTVGGNKVVCQLSTANCAAGSSGTVFAGYDVESGYAAAKGYDLASGLGSVDVAQLIANWSKISLKATTTTLSVNPSTLAHGTSTSISVTVGPATGTGTPTGSIGLTGNDGLSHSAGLGSGQLTSGALSTSLSSLPGGTYQLTAVYGGNGTYASSASTPVTVTVTPETDTLVASGWALNPYDLYLYPLSSGMTIPYGSQIFLDAQPTSKNSPGNSPPGTGTVTFTDTLGSTTQTSTQPLDSAGVAEWSTGVFSTGSHKISETYAGNASYNASTAASAGSFTVIPGSTSLSGGPLVSQVPAGASVSVQVTLTTGYLPFFGALPTGNVTVTLGAQTISAPLLAYGETGDASLGAEVTFTDVPAGILPVTASYPGNAHWLASAFNAGTVIALSPLLKPTVTLASTSASPTPSQNFTLTATVAGVSGKPAPTGTVTFVSNNANYSTTANLASGTAAATFSGAAGFNGANIVTALYSGDSNYNAATSSPVTITVAQPDFSLTTLNPELLIAPGGTATSTLALSPINGFSAAVSLSVSAQTGITVTPKTASPTVSAALTDVVTLAVAATVTPGVYPVNLIATGGGHAHTAQILVSVQTATTPLISLAAGTYTGAQQVTITDSTPGASIYYTVNKTTPTAASTKYTGPVTVSASETLEAIAVSPAANPSPVASAAYVIQLPAPTFSPAAGTFKTSQSVTISDAFTAASIYYTTNNTAPTTSSTKYTGPVTVSATKTLQAIAVLTGNVASVSSTAAYTISSSGSGTPPTPIPPPPPVPIPPRPGPTPLPIRFSGWGLE